METVKFEPMGKTKPKQTVKPKRPIKKDKVKTAFTVIKAVIVGICVGIIPCAVIAGNEKPWLYIIPFFPVIVYLIVRVIRDLKGWYEND